MTLFFPLNQGWEFRQLPAAGPESDWSVVDLPHTPFVADLDGRDHWFGECEYRRAIQKPANAPDGTCALYIGAAMHTAIVLVDDLECGRHSGGYLPFEIDLTAYLSDGREHILTLRLDNRDNPDVPPGKPSADLDFCWYGGLYRRAELRCYPSTHITDPIGADTPAGGGVFVRTLAANPQHATLSVKTHVRNTSGAEQLLRLNVELLFDGQTVLGREWRQLVVGAGSAQSVEVQLELAQPHLWHIHSPSLYQARVGLSSSDGIDVDCRTVRFGIRRIHFSRSGGFTINGDRLRLRGTNRHQEHPRVGYAVPAAAQRRDARRIKEAGFDYVRLSHYPQSSDFLDACDELGIVVMNCIPGWQFLGADRFREACCQNARDLIRRDRNHPCVVLWELALNETEMEADFMARLHAIGHEEYPGDQMYTCGWLDHYDVFIHSRQHGKILTWQNADKALVIAEYGDWEFYAANEGFDQKTGAGLFASWSHSRQRRRDGERGLRQQVFNHLVALNETLASPAVLDGQWSMFDYPRGYDPVRAACGVMDTFRLPKFSYHFYRSQRDPDETGQRWEGGPVVFIASYWSASSDLRIPVFSNCEEVELRFNGALVSRQRVSRTALSQNLPHPPFWFHLPAFAPGTLSAIGYVNNRPSVEHSVTTPGTASQVSLVVDDMAVTAARTEADVLIAHARICDRTGILCVDETPEVTFSVSDTVDLVGKPTAQAEAGIASVVLRVPAGVAHFELTARASFAGVALSDLVQWNQELGVTKMSSARGSLATIK
jgi:beta-galactosidase